MQSRYYDYNTCKFINADDPSILLADPFNVQCVHIYDYCENSPVINIDPTGYKMVLVGSKSDRQTILSQLKVLTGAGITLKMNSKGVVSYSVGVNKYKNSDKLIKRIINSKYMCTIRIQTKRGNDTTINNRYMATSLGSSATVWFNPNFKAKPQTINPKNGVVSQIDRPTYIGLAHELIHADRSMRGASISYDKYASYSYVIGYSVKFGWFRRTISPIYKTQYVLKEELATVGLKYNKSNDITENQIRKEHGLWLRGAY